MLRLRGDGLADLESKGLPGEPVRAMRIEAVEKRLGLKDAATVTAQLPAAYEHFNEVRPHSALKMKSPREFRRQHAAKQHEAQIEQALYCE